MDLTKSGGRIMKDRLLNISFYLGSVPVYWIYSKIKKIDTTKNEHYGQMVKLNLLLIYGIIVFIICFTLQNLLFYFDLHLAEIIPMELSFIVLGLVLVAYAFVWGEGLIAATIGSLPRLGFIRVRGIRKTPLGCTVIFMSIKYLVIITVLLLAVQSTNIAGSDVEEADVVMLYDNMGYIPRVVFTSGFYLESRAAAQRFGEDSVAVVPLTKESLSNALESSRLVYVASHGANGCIQLQGGDLLWPNDLKATPLSSNLQFVYLTGCETGLMHDEWQQHLKPAEVKTFSRLSATMEHVYWLLSEGPEYIRNLK